MRRLLFLGALLLAGCDGEHNPGGSDVVRTVVPDCDIELDEALAADEVAAAPGIEALYVRNAVGSSVPVDVDGDTAAGAVRWDFSQGPRDVGLRTRLQDPSEGGFDARFPSAEWTLPVALETPALLAPMRRVDTGLEILGAATADGSWDLVYDTPLQALPLPVGLGDAWGQRVVFRNARLAGLPNAGIEDWAFEVEADGAARLPGDITVEQVLRVRSTVVREFTVSDGEPVLETRLQWFAPCFGEVARAVLVPGDPNLASEYRRLEP